MDVQSFSEESFDPVVWINKSFDQIPEDGNREGHASGLVYKLQLFLQASSFIVVRRFLSLFTAYPPKSWLLFLLS